RYWMNLTPSDIMWNTSDTGWVKAAWSSVFAPWICGSCVFVHHMPQFKSEVIAKVSLMFYTVIPWVPLLSSSRDSTSHVPRNHPSIWCSLSSRNRCFPSWLGQVLWLECRGQLEEDAGYKDLEITAVLSNIEPKPQFRYGLAALPKALLLCVTFLQIVDEHGAVVPAGEEGTIAVRVQPARPFCLFSEYL
ncbi:ACSM3 synthetase, partial [Cercotrichas coryphoeus]|nr:ACSM3 synthetase [Cercotrichas coryphoeus]